MHIDQHVFLDGSYWQVILLNNTYATLQNIDKPKESKMIRV